MEYPLELYALTYQELTVLRDSVEQEYKPTHMLGNAKFNIKWRESVNPEREAWVRHLNKELETRQQLKTK